jgi:hypothetical protein
MATEMQELTMETSIFDVEGVGDKTAKVFTTTGLHTVGGVYTGTWQLIQDAIERLKAEADEGTIQRDPRFWLATASRCRSVANRIRSGDAVPFMPEQYAFRVRFVRGTAISE